MKFKEKIRNKLKNWLFADEIQRINNIEKSIEVAAHALKMSSFKLDKSQKEVEECRKLVTQMIDMGVDVGFHSDDHSWAVVCIAGHPEYVKFLPLTHRDARSVLDFLKQFRYSKQVIDSPFGFKSMLKDRFL